MSYGSAADEEHVLTYAASKDSSCSQQQQKQQSSSTIPMNSPSTLPTTEEQSQFQPAPPKTTTSTHQQQDINHALYTYPAITNNIPPNAVYDRVQSYAINTWNQCQPWTQFYSTQSISVPSFHSLSDRISTNVQLYKANYQVIAAFWLAIVFLFSIPSFLLATLFFFLLDRWASKQAQKNNGKLSHKYIVLIAFTSLIIIWVTGIAEHLITSLAFSMISVVCHATFHEPAVIETEIANV